MDRTNLRVYKMNKNKKKGKSINKNKNIQKDLK